jgi:hypothetical protein
MPLGPAQQYLAIYNHAPNTAGASDYVLPGYVQSENMDSVLNIASHYGAYLDGSESEDMGLSNKELTLALKVWENDYLSCKQQVELASTIIRSSRVFTTLYVQYTDRHYVALAKDIKMSKSVPSSVKTLDYEVTFECKPWLVGDYMHQLSGISTITTNDVSRTMANGAWTPTRIMVTGTNVTITGVTANGEPTGNIIVTGDANNLMIDTEAFTATTYSENMNSLLNADYRMYVGAGETIFTVTGASSCEIEYYDRWYI